MKFFALTKHGLVLIQTVLCETHFSARWIDELIIADHDDNWEEVIRGQVSCQICGATPPPLAKDYYLCGNIKVPKK